MYESRVEPLLSRTRFLLRMAHHALAVLGLLLFSLLLGMLGYLCFKPVSWHEALLDATLLLGGIGPLHMPQSVGGKIFIGLYGLYIALVFVAAAGLMLAPVAHRLLHKFHYDEVD
ncbi:MAG: hypothetical protein KAY06_02025 [Aeromonadaceae bacterium]|nr:hypothetical protein [Aeromonadaceae bacterium]